MRKQVSYDTFSINQKFYMLKKLRKNEKIVSEELNGSLIDRLQKNGCVEKLKTQSKNFNRWKLTEKGEKILESVDVKNINRFCISKSDYKGFPFCWFISLMNFKERKYLANKFEVK